MTTGGKLKRIKSILGVGRLFDLIFNLPGESSADPMRMRLLKAVLLLTVFLHGPTHAQARDSGFYLGVDVTMESMKVKSSGATESFGSGSSVVLSGGYEFSVAKGYSLLAGGFYDIDYYLQGGSGSSGTQFTRGSETLNQKVKWGIYAAPGVYLSDNTLLYAKLVYTTMKTDPEGVRSSSPNFSSVGYGLGLRHSVFKDHFIALEWDAMPVGTTSFPGFRSGAGISPGLTSWSLGWRVRF